MTRGAGRRSRRSSRSLISVPLATLAAVAPGPARRPRRPRRLGASASGMPAFWFGIVLIEIFAMHLQAAAGRRLGPSSRPAPRVADPARRSPRRSRSCRSSSAACASACSRCSTPTSSPPRAPRACGEPRVLFAHVARNALDPDADAARPQHRLPGRQHGRSSSSVFALNGLGSLLLDVDHQPRLPGGAGDHARAGDGRRARQPAHRPARGPPRPEDPPAMSAVDRSPSASARRARAPPRSGAALRALPDAHRRRCMLSGADRARGRPRAADQPVRARPARTCPHPRRARRGTTCSAPTSSAATSSRGCSTPGGPTSRSACSRSSSRSASAR